MTTSPRFSPDLQFRDANRTPPSHALTAPRGPRRVGAPAPGRIDANAGAAMTHDFLLANLHPEFVRDAIAAEERRLCAIDL